MSEEKNNKIKVLMVLGSFQYGGAETLNLYILKNIDRSKYQIDYVVTHLTGTHIEKEILSLGSTIHVLPKYSGFNYIKYVKAWKNLLSKNHYDIVHGHAVGPMSIYLSIAKKAGCITIAHSHSAFPAGNPLQRLIKKIMSLKVRRKADYRIACSKLAAIKLFGKHFDKNKNYSFLPNGIDTNKFKYDSKKRDSIRKKLSIDKDAIVIGNVGRLDTQKNQCFLLEIFSQVLKEKPNSFCVICGDGPLKEHLSSKAKECQIEKRVIFAGTIPNINEYYSAMDLFVFPSLFEGLPIAMIEAQTSGLPILYSDVIANEVCVTRDTHALSLSKSSSEWAQASIDLLNQNKDRIKDFETIDASIFTIKNTSNILSNIYDSLLANKK